MDENNFGEWFDRLFSAGLSAYQVTQQPPPPGYHYSPTSGALVPNVSGNFIILGILAVVLVIAVRR